MKHYSEAAVERTMKVREVILRALDRGGQRRDDAALAVALPAAWRRWAS